MRARAVRLGALCYQSVVGNMVDETALTSDTSFNQGRWRPCEVPLVNFSILLPPRRTRCATAIDLGKIQDRSHRLRSKTIGTLSSGISCNSVRRLYTLLTDLLRCEPLGAEAPESNGQRQGKDCQSSRSPKEGRKAKGSQER